MPDRTHLPPWLSEEDLLDGALRQELATLISEASELEPKIRALAVRSWHAIRRYGQAMKDAPDDAHVSDTALHDVVRRMFDDLGGVVGSMPSAPDWKPGG